MRQPKIAIIILNWNGLQDTIDCIKSIQQSGYENYSIVVIDNNSDNDEAGQLTRLFKDIKVIKNDKNYGVAGGNNIGLRHVFPKPEIEYVVLMNNDLVISKKSLQELVSAVEKDTNIGMVASRMMNYYDKSTVDNLGIYLLKSGLGYNRKNIKTKLFCPCSGFALYRKKALQDIAINDNDVWDNDFFAYVDELDVGFRLRLMGYEAAYADNAVAYHKEGSTSGGPVSDFSIFHGHRNNVWFIIKNFPLPYLLRNLPNILLAQLATFILYTKRKRLGIIIKAKYAGIKNISKMLRKRKKIQKNTKTSFSNIKKHIVNKSIVNAAKEKY